MALISPFNLLLFMISYQIPNSLAAFALAVPAPLLLHPRAEDETNDTGPHWFNRHWKWVVMLIVLLVGLSTIAVIAVCVKRHYYRKLEARARLNATSNTHMAWGPPQQMALTPGTDYTMGGANPQRPPNYSRTSQPAPQQRVPGGPTAGVGGRRKSKRLEKK
ncbi:MAG: hypothetical protein M1834_006391 [Cirrosporium novae-zelandiae]|nr:MAG: hypothetical protein M1834_006391 [Cirrosporium novae-zelandiae]